jgi:hypothetical protein
LAVGRDRGVSSGGRGGGSSSRRSFSSTTNLTVPVLLGVAEALTNGDTPVSELSESLKHKLGQVVDSLLMDVVTNLEP